MDNVIVAGEYSHKVTQTEEEEEMDHNHGIFENDYESLNISLTGFTLRKHYYYEYEDWSYRMETQDTQDLNFEGTVEIESPSVWICRLSKGSYENSTVHKKDAGDGLTGTFKVTALPNKKLKLSHATIEKDGKPFEFAIKSVNECRELSRKG